ncbi:hypothetical protein ANCDUO_21713 [Ancylostoma duodenale]|uniref:Uncharacterized protein n=1 Tax=Ancylostoma duodenale TaxID=51022 RepID=A0A0C2FHZ2_9BILA|nr:hypothetical protein ANCDUO_21713 [Ancylostoma duodenale]
MQWYLRPKKTLRTSNGTFSRIEGQAMVQRRNLNGVGPFFSVPGRWISGHQSRPISTTGFCYLVSPGAKCLLFQTHVTGFAEYTSGEGLGRNLDGNECTHSLEFSKEMGCLYQR